MLILVIFRNIVNLLIFCRKYEELAKVAEETNKNFAAYERDDLKLREVGRLLATGLATL